VLVLVAACAAFAWPSASTLVPENGGHPRGDAVWAWLFLACGAAAVAAYAAGVLLLRRAAVPSRAALALAVVIQLAPLGAPLLLSTDAWTYWSYGRIAAVHDGNPYVDPPSEFPRDPAYAWIGEDWRDTTSVYGPAFTLASEPLARAAGTSEEAAAWIYKALAAAAIVAATLLAARLSRRPALAAALVGWNPVLALHLAGGGHNDAWVAALVVGALALGASGRRQLPGVLWALAILVKWVPLVFLALRALEARSTGRRVGHLGFAVTAAAAVAAATWRYGLDWARALGPLARNAETETSYALPHRLEQLGVPDRVALGLAVAGLALALLWLGREALRGRARLGLAAAALLLATPYLTPWYLAWLLPLAAAEDDDAARWLGVGLTAYLLPQTIPV
jgi:alpha-1,6-mannosyltransferase